MIYNNGLPLLMISTTLRAVMIYQTYGLDKKILQKTYPFLQYFLVEMWGFEFLHFAKQYSFILAYALQNTAVSR